MKLKLYYGAIVILWLLYGCTQADPTVARAHNGSVYRTVYIKGHEYLESHSSLCHSGSCRKCKQELKDIIRSVTKEERSPR